jgi:WD40 repeat protein
VTPDGKYAISASRDASLRLWRLADGIELFTLIGHKDPVRAAELTQDACSMISISDLRTMRIWALDWNYEFPTPADWDEGALSYLQIFLSRETGTTTPAGVELDELLGTLARAGYGWLRPEGVRRRLQALAAKGTE